MAESEAMTRQHHPDDLEAARIICCDRECLASTPKHCWATKALTAIAEAQERRGNNKDAEIASLKAQNLLLMVPLSEAQAEAVRPLRNAAAHRAGWEQGVADAAKKMRLALGIIEDMGATEDRLVLQQRVAMATCINETLLAVEALTYPTPATESETKE